MWGCGVCGMWDSGVRLMCLMILQELDYLCTKLVVPSMGSMIHVGLSVSSPCVPVAAVDSSPINLYHCYENKDGRGFKYEF